MTQRFIRQGSAVFLGLLAGCQAFTGVPEGSVSATVVWAAGQPASVPAGAVFFARIEKRSNPLKAGTVLQVIGPAGSRGSLAFQNVVNDPVSEMVVIVEVHQTGTLSSPVLYDGVSPPFALEPAENRTVTVVLGTLPAAPDTSAPRLITYLRNPWGSQATKGVASFAIQAAAGAVRPGVTAVAYDGPDPLHSSQIGTQDADTTGAFAMVLTPTDRETVYLATLDAAANPSPSSAVLHVQWTATFGGKISGESSSNPHVMETVENMDFVPAGPNYLAPLVPDPSTALEPASYAALRSPSDGMSLATRSAANWHQRVLNIGPTSRAWEALAYDSVRGVTVMYGGAGSFTESDIYSDTWEWNGNEWTDVSPVGIDPGPQGLYAMAYDAAAGVTLLLGSNATSTASATWGWNGSVWSDLTGTGPNPPLRENAAMAYDARRAVVVLFGGNPILGGGADDADTWEWAKGAWSQAMPSGPRPQGRTGHVMAYCDTTGVVLLYGGISTSDETLTDTWQWNGSAWQNMTPASGGPLAPPEGSTLSMMYDNARATVVLLDGPAVFEWDGSVWNQTGSNAPTGPLAYDAARDTGVLFSSIGGLPTTYLWNGTAWSSGVSSTGSPPQILDAVLSFDSGRDVSVLFDDTAPVSLVPWEWNGTAWSSPAPSGASPPTRGGYAAVYDPGQYVTYMFGGQVFDNTTSEFVGFSDFWSWDGTNWVSIPAAGPPAINGGSMVYDVGRRRDVLFGNCADSTICDTALWEWDGTTWYDVTPAAGNPGDGNAGYAAPLAYDSGRATTLLGDVDPVEWNGMDWTYTMPSGPAPAQRSNPGLTYDPVRGATLLFGGTSLNDSWEWDGSDWADVTPVRGNPTATPQATMVYDTSRSTRVLYTGTGLQRTWESPSDTAGRPAQLAQFSFGAAGSSPYSIEGMSFTAAAGAAGNSVQTPPARGSPLPGTTLAVWDSWAGLWHSVSTNVADIGSEAPLTYSTASAVEATRYLFAPTQSIVLALFPTQGRGNGAQPAEVTVDYVELTVQYDEAVNTTTEVP